MTPRCAIEGRARSSALVIGGQSGGAAPESAAKVRLEGGVGGIEQLSPRNHDDIHTTAVRQGLRLPENLSNQSFSAISPHGVPEFPRGHNAEPGDPGGIGRHQHRQIPSLRSVRLVEDPCELGAATHPARLGEALGRHGRSPAGPATTPTAQTTLRGACDPSPSGA